MKVFKVIRNVLLGAIALVLLLLVVLQVVLRPAVLTGIVNRIAADYVQGEVSFRQVKAHVIKSFPYLNVEAEDFVITYPHNRYARYDTLYAQVREPLLQAGRHPEADTLVSLKGLELSINYRDLARGAYNIRRAELRHPRIFAHYYDTTAANWDILPIGPSGDGERKPLPSIRVHRVLLSQHPLIVYTHPADTLFGQFSMARLGLEGEIHSLEPGQIRARLEADTLAVSGRLPSDTLTFRLDRLRAGAERRHFTLEADAHASLQTRRYGRFLLPVGLEAEGDVPEREDEALEVDLERLGIRLASLEVTGDGWVVKRPDAWDMDMNARAKDAPLGELIGTFQENFPALKKWKTDAVLSLDAHATGTYGGDSVPVITASLLVPDASLDHESLGRSGRISLDADMRTDNLNRVDADIRRLLFDIVGAHIDASGSALDFLGKDPQFVLDADILARLDSLTQAFTRERGILATGSIRAGLHGKVRMSQLNGESIGKADIDCNLQGEDLSVEDAPDSLHAYIRRVNAHLATQKGTALSLKALFDTLDVTYKKDIYARGTALDAALTPLAGQIRLSSLELRDDEGLTVAVRDNSESFRMTPASEEQPVPRFHITSGSGLIHVNDGPDSYILDSLRLSVSASRHKARQRQEGGRRPAPDSLRRARRPRQQDDFSSADISISLSRALSQYVRDWDFSGRVGLDEGLLMLPAFPLFTRVSSLQGTLDNDSVDLERITVQAGVSDITAKARLTGLRRALLSRGRRAPLKLDATVQSEYIDANELMRAYAYYTTYRPEGEETAVSYEALDTIQNPSKLLVLPSNLDLTLQLEGTGLKYDSLLVNWLAADVAMRNRTLQITNTVASSNMGDIYFEGFYATRSRQDIQAGFDLNLVDITAEKVITLFPAVDTIMPMLTSFAGDLDCELAATAEIDTCMNLVLPSVDGILKISGKDLSLKESEEFTRMARKLMFRNQDEARIDNMAVTGMVRDNLLEVFPFILDVDRYLFAASGVQNLDRGFDYHISVIRSPLLVKFGVNAWGETFDDVHYDVTKAKYRSTNVPVFTKQLDTVQYSLLAAIHNIFELGVEKALAENNSRQVLQSQADEIPEREAPPVDLDSESMQRISVLYEDVTERLTRRREALKQEVLELEEAVAVRNKEEDDEQ